jgi:hypothetical protein
MEEPAQAPQAEAPCVVIFVGGFGDRIIRRVSGFALAEGGFAQAHPELGIRCFEWTEARELLACIRGQRPGARLRLAGHSYGADTAAKLAAHLAGQGQALDLLVTADPVSRRSRPDLAQVRRGARRWININATGGGPFEPSNIVARIGGAWRHAPHRFAHESLDHAVPHADFAGLLRCRLADGRTVAETLAAP